MLIPFHVLSGARIVVDPRRPFISFPDECSVLRSTVIGLSYPSSDNGLNSRVITV